MGDAVCTFNPIYGQGMSVVALQALALRAHLQQHTRPQPVRFLRQIGRIVDVPWSMAIGGDLAFPNVAGQRTTQMRVLNGYLAMLFAGVTRPPARAGVPPSRRAGRPAPSVASARRGCSCTASEPAPAVVGTAGGCRQRPPTSGQLQRPGCLQARRVKFTHSRDWPSPGAAATGRPRRSESSRIAPTPDLPINGPRPPVGVLR